ncbi:AMP-binding enzyme [Elsinoe ampelina]|uniref:AMP-binding enzyme n=1 Tax=Elsinoe ampelina TaxID=302913 RepID=A0A6A6G0E8_9PEZI|nr:AMP-binding enzyme [Elsinoe ampelina]
MHDAIAIIGSGCRFPGDTTTPSKLWQLLQDPKDLRIPVPPSRFNAAGFYHKIASHHGHSNVKDMKSYYLSNDPVERWFDAPFFGINAAEANVLDPQLRLLMETTYEALESAGLPMESLQGSDTGCYVGLMIGEYEQFMMRDPESVGQYHVMGTARSLMANRLSYFFDWHGPSMTIDTACSSSLVAIHQCVQLLRSGQSRVAIAAGSNMILDPITHISESKLSMLSPDGQSRMWDAGANGYARGEGVATIVLKRLSDALVDGDQIESIIRETGLNQDGKTRGITLPSATAQTALIQSTYSRAGLGVTNPLQRPHYFEAHGTGTPAGDPIEAEAIHAAFFDRPSGTLDTDHEPLYVGSIKTVCGHTEGTAGIAAVLKASLAIQNAVVPPNLLFEKMNPRIERFSEHLRVPTSLLPWPSTHGQPRRASINSFGFGGANAHVILESCAEQAPVPKVDHRPVPVPFVFSAASGKSLQSYLKKFAEYVAINREDVNLDDVAFTLHSRRSRLPLATSVVASGVDDLLSTLHERIEVGALAHAFLQPNDTPGSVIGVFTGQGAQWPRMGVELLTRCPAATDMFATLESRLDRLPIADKPSWSLRDELERTAAAGSRVGEAELSQPLCTAVQLVLVHLLRSAGITFDAVVGHSSGEIAAAYAAGIISAEDAICIAYYRGLHGKLAAGEDGWEGAMLAAGITPDDAAELLESDVFRDRANIAAYNSSNSLTLSGDADAIEELKEILEDEDKFARTLKVEKAYHSHHMRPCAVPYATSLKALEIQLHAPKCTWISSVSGRNIVDHGLENIKDQYWVDNATKPVLFMQALQQLCRTNDAFDCNLAIEIGPHPALQAPATQTLKETTGRSVPYTGLLKRGTSDTLSVAAGLGFAWMHLPRGTIDLNAYHHFCSDGTSPRLVKDLPTYSWNHENEYWHESRYTKSVMTRRKHHELLGHTTADVTMDNELRWRQILSPSEIPWLNGHRLQNQIVFPAAGYVVLAVEAARELLSLRPECGPAALIHVYDINIKQAMTFDSEDSRVEAVFSLLGIKQHENIVSANFGYSAASIGTNHKAENSSPLRPLVTGHLEITLGKQDPDALPTRSCQPDLLLPVKAEDFYESLQKMEYDYTGPFRALSNLQRKLGTVTGSVSTEDDPESELLVQPGMLDAAFQAVLLAKAAPYDGALWSMHVPKTIDRVTINPIAWELYETRGKLLPLEAYQRHGSSSRSFKGDVDIYPEAPRAGGSASHALIQVEGLDCVPFSPATVQDDKEILSTIVWKHDFPDATKAAHDLSFTADPSELELAYYLERVSFYYLRKLEESIPQDDVVRRADHPLSNLFSFARYVGLRVQDGKLAFWRNEWFQDTRETLLAASGPFAHVADYKLLTRIGENLPDIVKGRLTAIEAARKDDLLNEFYPVALGMAYHTTYLARTVKQLTHRFPHLRILELGAGTGSATKATLGLIGDDFASYTFTDISSGFFPKAKEFFDSTPSSSRISYKILDISKDPEKQGFVPQAYDLVIASQVLHATPVMENSIRNVRSLLKPGGFLVVNEGINNETARLGTIFGAFPGWWLGAENDGRHLGPNLAVSEWDKLLRSTGFSGVESSVPVVDPLLTPNTVFVSQAIDRRIQFIREPLGQSKNIDAASETALQNVLQELIIIGGSTPMTLNAINGLKPLLRDHCGALIHYNTLAELEHSGTRMSQGTTILSLSDIDEPLFENLTDQSLQAFKDILHAAGSVFWVTQGRYAANPTANITIGAVRTAMLEIPTLSFQSLDYEDTNDVDSARIAESFLRFVAGVAWMPRKGDQESMFPMLWTVEREIIQDQTGQSLIPRVIPEKNMNDRYNSARRSILRDVPIEDGDDEVCIAVASAGDNEHVSLEQVELQASSSMLRLSCSILLAQRIHGLGHVYLCLAKDTDGELRVILSDKVTSVIHAHDSLSAVSIDQRSFGLDGLGAGPRFLHLVSTNLLAIEIVNELAPGDHLVAYEPDLEFANILKRAARCSQVNITIVTAALSQERCQRLGWHRIHPQSSTRSIQTYLPDQVSLFLECGHSQPSTSPTFSARIRSALGTECRVAMMTDWLATIATKRKLASATDDNAIGDRLRLAVDRAQHDRFSSKVDIQTVSVGRVNALSATYDEIARNWCKAPVVMEWEGVLQASVNVRPIDHRNLFSRQKTYWLAGLTGSLGASLCEWMLSHGAETIILTSRTPKMPSTWLERMSRLGGSIHVHSVDLTNFEQTEAFYRDMSSVLPPIGGVASGAMVLRDTTLRNMTLDDMQQVCRPKVLGTSNLDRLFYGQNLDFFIAFSSLTAVTGNPGQSNYSAANLFMCSLVEQRRRRGLAASVIHIAPILGVGYVSEKSDRTKTNFPRTSGYSLTAEQDFRQLFAEAVVAGKDLNRSSGPVEIVLGLLKVSPNPEKLPYWFEDPMASHYIRNGDTADVSKTSAAKTSTKAMLASVATREQAVKVLTDAIKPFIASMFQLQGGSDLDDADFLGLELDDIGLDSLLAVETRTWWLKTVQVNIPVMKLLSGISIGQLISIAIDSLPPDLVPHLSNKACPTDQTPEPSKQVVQMTDSNASTSDDSSLKSSSHTSLHDPTAESTPISIGTPDSEPRIDPDSSVPSLSISKSPDLSVSRVQKLLPEPEVERWVDLSFGQMTFWFVLTFLDDKAGLNHTGLFRLTGALDVTKLERSVKLLGQRHEILRTCFADMDGRVKQGVMRDSRLALECRTILHERDAFAAAEDLQSYKWDFAQGESLRIILLEFGPRDYFLLYGTHSLVLDGISGTVLTRELSRLYTEESSSEEGLTLIQYPTYAESQIKALESGKFEASLRFWREELASCPPPLPVLRIVDVINRPVQRRYDNQRVDAWIDGATKARIWAICRQQKIRPFHFFLTVFRALLSRLAATEELCIGIVDANRSHEGALQSLGPFINLLPLRFSNSAQQNFGAALKQTKSKSDLALTHSDVPFEAILNDLAIARSSTHAPIFQTFFDYRQGMSKKQQFDDCELELLSFQASNVPYDVSMDISDDSINGECHLMLIVREDMYSKKHAELLLGCYVNLVASFTETPTSSFGDAQIYDPRDIERALAFGINDAVPSKWPYESVLDRILDIAKSSPQEVAIKLPFNGDSMTYQEMSDKAMGIACALREQGCIKGSVVATFQEATPDWLASLLGIFSVGASYAPFDGSTPTKRLLDMVEDCKACIVLVDNKVSQETVKALDSGSRRKLINVAHIRSKTTSSGTTPVSLSAEDPAMILYSSGSTGVPKGIVLKHGGLRNWAEFMPDLYRSGQRDTVLTQSSCGFDMSYLQAFFALCHGGTVCICPRTLRVDAKAITNIIADEGVTVTCAVPSEYTNWLRFGDPEALARCTKWRTAMCGGEPGTNVVLELQASLGPQPRSRFFHIYGPTEITFITTESPAVGGPFPNYSVYVLDEQLKPVPPGVQGEIYVGGAGVATGYLENANLTAEKFFSDPFAPPSFVANGWTTMHQTGDNGRWREDGGLLIEGRKAGDTQHKLRGLRIDLQEIEHVILQESQGLLSDAVVSVLRPSAQRPEFLVAHVRFDPTLNLLDAPRKQLLDKLSSGLPLPQYMWPAVIVPINELPFTASGKLDRRAVAALPLPDSLQRDNKPSDDDLITLTETESQLKQLWEEIISRDITKLHRIGPDTDFFRVGGTSLLLLRLQAQIRQKFGLVIPFVELFESSTLSALSLRIENKGKAPEAKTFSWDRETSIPEPILDHLASASAPPPDASSRTVILTGSTGVVGRALLASLIADPAIHTIHCIAIRDLSSRRAQLPTHAKVKLHEGDLTRPLLGLPQSAAESIFSSADRIIHNGADTSHLKTYHSLQAVNLGATKEVVSLCVRFGRLIPLHYVSTASVLQYSGLEEFGEESAAKYPPPVDGLDGYSASKWASEVFLEKLKDSPGGEAWGLWVHRLSSVQGAEGDEMGALEVIPNLLKYSRAAKAVPSTGNLKGWINLVPLRQAVVGLQGALREEPWTEAVRFKHEIGDVNVRMDGIKDYIERETGSEAKVLEMDQWARLVQGLGMDPLLVEFFLSLVKSPNMVWPLLSKRREQGQRPER